MVEEKIEGIPLTAAGSGSANRSGLENQNQNGRIISTLKATGKVNHSPELVGICAPPFRTAIESSGPDGYVVAGFQAMQAIINQDVSQDT